MTSYGEDRSAIEDLQARYMFALDWQSPDDYAATFTEDGVLDWAGGIVEGRETIRAECQDMRAFFSRRAAGDAPTRPARLRHFITNVVIRIEGDRAWSQAYWFEIDNDTRLRWPYVGGYGHYEDELRKEEDGQWRFTRRKIFNECMSDRAASDVNPAGVPA
jgi:ketosteroid isomerase-like protein